MWYTITFSLRDKHHESTKYTELFYMDDTKNAEVIIASKLQTTTHRIIIREIKEYK